ncbi:hypothetical protein B0O99DRAFT_101502 [Bisporella sp. PMI_857]|nr:hypothetical protein B0O99DRAFT_101502 [Bisporella sp. PMI_857]
MKTNPIYQSGRPTDRFTPFLSVPTLTDKLHTHSLGEETNARWLKIVIEAPIIPVMLSHTIAMLLECLFLFYRRPAIQQNPVQNSFPPTQRHATFSGLYPGRAQAMSIPRASRLSPATHSLLDEALSALPSPCGSRCGPSPYGPSRMPTFYSLPPLISALRAAACSPLL